MLKLLFLDTETTGNDPQIDRLCQICFKASDEITTEFFKPPIPISIKSMSITHITNKHVADKDPFIESPCFHKLKKLLEDHTLVAHNAVFDIAMLKSEGIDVENYICTLKLARFLDSDGKIEEYNLQFLRYLLDLEVDGNAHDAECDVKVLEALFNRLYEKVRIDLPDENEALQEMIRISSQPTLMKKFNFGKHRGKEVLEVAQTDRDYLLWLLNQKLTNNQDDVDWIFTLEHYTKSN